MTPGEPAPLSGAAPRPQESVVVEGDTTAPPGDLTTRNELALLENGEAFFPAVFDAIRSARSRVIVETFIVFEDGVGKQLRTVLMQAARRGVSVDLTVDGYGTADLSSDYIDGLTQAGVRFHMFDPRPRRLGFRTNMFRRLHRKIVVVDDAVAFIGGINYCDEHLADYGEEAKQDYAVAIRGPAVDAIRAFSEAALENPVRVRRPWRRLGWPRRKTPEKGTVALVVRDNDHHTNDIELHYRLGIRSAKHSIVIANAYFFPGYFFLRDLRHAARRGVKVRLILQGQPDMPIARYAATMLYDYLVSGGVEIYEYCERPLHGKVAVIDDAWSTVGSSNLDPLSLALNLEANVMIYDAAFSLDLRERLDRLVREHCRAVVTAPKAGRNLQRIVVSTVLFHILRRFPRWVRSLPQTPRPLQSILPAAGPDSPDAQPGVADDASQGDPGSASAIPNGHDMMRKPYS